MPLFVLAYTLQCSDWWDFLFLGKSLLSLDPEMETVRA